MQVTVSRVSPVEISLRVALPKERVSSALEAAFSELGKQAQIRGFRKGKVPRPLLKQYFGGQVAEQVARKLVDETLSGAIRDQRIEPINQPRVEATDELNGGAEWAYTALMEVRPDIGELDLSSLQITRTIYAVADEDVTKAVDAKREENATLRTPEPSRPAIAGDTVTIDMNLSLDGAERPEFSSKGRPVEVGASRLLKAIDDALVGMSVGESKDVDVNFPESHRQRELAGKTAQMKVSVTAHQEKVLPDLDDDFAKDVGKESLEQLRADLRAELEKAAKERSDDEARSAAVEAFVKANPIPVPPSLVEQAIGAMRQDFARSFAMKGEAIPAELNVMLQKEAEDRMRAGLLLTELARVNNIVVSEDDLNAQLEELAKETGKAVQRLRVEYREKAKRDQLVAQVLEGKVLDLLLAKVTVTEKAAETPEAAKAE